MARTAHDRLVSTAGERLTEPELAALRHLPTQLTQRDIARALYVSLTTVTTHVSATCRGPASPTARPRCRLRVTDTCRSGHERKDDGEP